MRIHVERASNGRRNGCVFATVMRLAVLALGLCGIAGSARADSLDGSARASSRLTPWADGEPRPFLGGYVDAGAIYVRPQLQVGHGQPHWQWFGIEAYALTTNGFFGAYAGTRATLPFLEFTMGVRHTRSYVRSFVPPRERYDSSHLDSARDGRARYVTVDYELSGIVPVPGGYLLWGALATHVLDTPANVDVYEEAMRVVMRPPFVVDLRGGYVVAIGHDEQVKVGALSETLVLPGRHATIVRIGPVASVRLTLHTDAILVLTSAVHGPDSLDLYDGSYGFVGLRYRWATGERAARFP